MNLGFLPQITKWLPFGNHSQVTVTLNIHYADLKHRSSNDMQFDVKCTQSKARLHFTYHFMLSDTSLLDLPTTYSTCVHKTILQVSTNTTGTVVPLGPKSLSQILTFLLTESVDLP
jgi:hypothetical protein